ncbi:MAG: nickel pincer cofactor biosynthesis protein LarB [Spirochaetales bacterium]|nr:nickel pincer cofactor biosynthesis protein LarB [Spirochaetales bacterium]
MISLELGVAEVDVARHVRTGFPEVVFCPNKTDDDIASIVKALTAFHETVLCTKARPSTFALLSREHPETRYYEKSGAIVIGKLKEGTGKVSVVCAGTSDIPVAEEAAVTARCLGAAVDTHWDVGVAGLHRLLSKIADLRRSRAIVAVAGMDGALPSVLAGLVSCPVVAVPTSVGYGASFGGVAALLTMLNSCAPGVASVNIDNGFGAGYIASLINKRGEGD